MKKLLFLIIFLTASCISHAQVLVPQDTLIMNNGNKVPVFFQYENESSYIVSKNLNGEPKMNVAKRMVDRLIIVDRDSNLAALAVDQKKEVAIQSRVQDTKVTNYIFEGGQHLEKAGKALFWTAALSGGSLAINIALSINGKENKPIQRLGQFMQLGSVLALGSTVVQLKKAGNNLQRQKTLTYYVGPLGGGLAVRF